MRKRAGADRKPRGNMMGPDEEGSLHRAPPLPPPYRRGLAEATCFREENAVATRAGSAGGVISKESAKPHGYCANYCTARPFFPQKGFPCWFAFKPGLARCQPFGPGPWTEKASARQPTGMGRGVQNRGHGVGRGRFRRLMPQAALLLCNRSVCGISRHRRRWTRRCCRRCRWSPRTTRNSVPAGLRRIRSAIRPVRFATAFPGPSSRHRGWRCRPGVP